MNRLLSGLLICCCVSAELRAEDHTISEFDLVDVQGMRHTRATDWPGKRALVFIFLATECPAVDSYAPTIERLARDFAKRRVLLYGVQCDPDVTAEGAQRHAREFGLTIPILLDPGQILARQSGTTRTATAVVADSTGRIVYRGRIDDRFPSLGKRRDGPRTHDLNEVLETLLAGQPLLFRETEVVGCPLPKRASPKPAVETSP